jgi:hypothetical protein
MEKKDIGYGQNGCVSDNLAKTDFQSEGVIVAGALSIASGRMMRDVRGALTTFNENQNFSGSTSRFAKWGMVFRVPFVNAGGSGKRPRYQPLPPGEAAARHGLYLWTKLIPLPEPERNFPCFSFEHTESLLSSLSLEPLPCFSPAATTIAMAAIPIKKRIKSRTSLKASWN